MSGDVWVSSMGFGETKLEEVGQEIKEVGFTGSHVTHMSSVNMPSQV